MSANLSTTGEGGYEEIGKKQDDPEKKNAIIAIVALLIILISLVLSGSFLPTVLNAASASKERAPTVVDDVIETIINTQSDYSIIPSRFKVDENYLLPPTNQAQRGTCWIFATLFLLESQYRENGIRKGFLQPNQYVSLSKQAYGAWLGEQCLAHPETPICHHGAYSKYNNTEDQLVDSIYYFAKAFPDLTYSVLPEEVCPYFNTTSNSTDFVCPGMYDAIKTNPFEFSIKSISYAANVNDTKKLLVQKQRPLGIGIGIGVTEFFAPCDSSSYSTSSQCVNKETLCPDGYTSQYCHKVTVESRDDDGAFTFVQDFNRTSFLGAHEMNIVGYNDDWIYNSRFTTSKSLANLKGGFILHNSWRSQGHSVDYLLGRRSEENENVICPNHADPHSWLPGTVSCLLTSGKNMSRCAATAKVVRGKDIVNTPDLLKCTNAELCNTNYNYALATPTGADAFTVSHLFSGLDAVTMIQWDENNAASTIVYDKLPFHHLNDAFEPVDLVPNNDLDCGYYMYPYDAIASVQQHDWSLLDYFHTSDVEFEFPDSAYAANKANGKNYTLLEQSTHQWDQTPFDGPLPYQYVY